MKSDVMTTLEQASSKAFNKPIGIKTAQQLFFSFCVSIGFVTALVVAMLLMA